MKKAALTSQIKDPNSAVLIIDKIGVVGEKLAEEFSKDFYVVLFSGRYPEKINNKISFISFKNRIPKIPKNRYSKIFLIDDGKAITKDSSFSFIKEAKELGADFYFLGSVRNFDIKHADELVKTYDKTKVLVFGDLFDKKFLFDHDCSITKFILEAGNRKRIKVPGEGLSLNYPINFEDTIKLILKAVYLKIPEKIILLFYKTPITDISLAHLFQKIDPDIKVDFEKKFRTQEIFIPDGAQFAISKYDLKKRIEEINVDEPKKVLIKNKKTKFNNYKFLKIFGALLILIFFLMFLPFITSQIYLSLGEKQLKNSIKLAQNYEYEKALDKASNANSFLGFSMSANAILSKQLSLINKGYINWNTNNKIQNKLNLSSTLDSIYGSAFLFEQIYNNKSLDDLGDFNKMLALIQSSYVDFEKLDIDNSYNNLENTASTIGLLTKTSDVLPEVLGFDIEKTYLVLLQDSNELRPGGGKITSVVEIKVKEGTLSSFNILNTDELDKKMKVHVEPPFAIRRYLPSTDYFLKDSNFEPDFIKSAIATSAIYKLETGKEVDGIIGVDLYFLEYLLKKIGPVYIEELGKNITAENIHQAAWEYEDFNNNESFTTLLLKNIKLSLSETNISSPFLILEIIDKAVKEKHILFAFKDKEIQNVFNMNSLTGSLVDNRNKSKDKVNDTFGLFEANLGLNKINYFISRSVSKKNIIENNGEMNSEVVIAFKNNSQKNSSANVYKNYMQIILPKGTVLNQVSVAGKNQDIISAVIDYRIFEKPNFLNPEGLEIEQSTDSNISIFGFLISVALDSIQTVKLNYTLPFIVSTQTNSLTNYSLLIFKQPGINSFPFNLIFDDSNEYLILPQEAYSIEIKNDEIIESIITKK